MIVWRVVFARVGLFVLRAVTFPFWFAVILFWEVSMGATIWAFPQTHRHREDWQMIWFLFWVALVAFSILFHFSEPFLPWFRLPVVLVFAFFGAIWAAFKFWDWHDELAKVAAEPVRVEGGLENDARRGAISEVRAE